MHVLSHSNFPEKFVYQKTFQTVSAVLVVGLRITETYLSLQPATGQRLVLPARAALSWLALAKVPLSTCAAGTHWVQVKYAPRAILQS